MEVTMAQDRMKKNKRPGKSQPERRRRIIELQYDAYTRVIEFRIFVLRPDGEKARALGGGAFEEQDLAEVAGKLAQMDSDFTYCDALAEAEIEEALAEAEIEKDEGEDV
jgi:hypothetical protein